MRKREILGLVLLITGASGIFLSVRQAPPQYVYLTAGRDIYPGEIVANSDFRTQSLYLASSALQYVSGDMKLQGHRSLRKISRGEVIPRDALTSESEIEQRRLLTFQVSLSEAPPALKVGDLVDIYFFSLEPTDTGVDQATLIDVVEKIRIKEMSKGSEGLDGKVTLSALFVQEIAPEVLKMLASAKVSVAQRFDTDE